jgi:hypothetical protein
VGLEFNRLTKNIIFVKLMKSEHNYNFYPSHEKHFGFQYVTGLNIDTIPFNPNGFCKEGGLYFCECSKFYMYLDDEDYEIKYIRRVLIPDDAMVYVERNKFKADRIILSEKKLISELNAFNYESECLKFIEYNTIALRYIKNPSLKLRTKAFKKSLLALYYINGQIEEICLESVKINGMSLSFVKKQTLQICIEAVKQNRNATIYVDEKFKQIVNKFI